jgi:hypothetical protein
MGLLMSDTTLIDPMPDDTCRLQDSLAPAPQSSPAGHRDEPGALPDALRVAATATSRGGGRVLGDGDPPTNAASAPSRTSPPIQASLLGLDAASDRYRSRSPLTVQIDVPTAFWLGLAGPTRGGLV